VSASSWDLQEFREDLNYHLLSRLLDKKEDQVTMEELRRFVICRETLYRHKVCRINYTSYDKRRCQDSINPRTHADIMLPSPDGDPERPYWFARVVGIFHVNVMYGEKSELMHFLWVRWFGHDYTRKTGFKYGCLPRIGFVPDASDPMGFVDPSTVIRSAHILPAFKYGRTDIYLGPSIARIPQVADQDANEDPNEDWTFYYVGM
jgi:hypothetical protein